MEDIHLEEVDRNINFINIILVGIEIEIEIVKVVMNAEEMVTLPNIVLKKEAMMIEAIEENIDRIIDKIEERKEEEPLVKIVIIAIGQVFIKNKTLSGHIAKDCPDPPKKRFEGNRDDRFRSDRGGGGGYRGRYFGSD